MSPTRGVSKRERERERGRTSGEGKHMTQREREGEGGRKQGTKRGREGEGANRPTKTAAANESKQARNVEWKTETQKERRAKPRRGIDLSCSKSPNESTVQPRTLHRIYLIPSAMCDRVASCYPNAAASLGLWPTSATSASHENAAGAVSFGVFPSFSERSLHSRLVLVILLKKTRQS